MYHTYLNNMSTTKQFCFHMYTMMVCSNVWQKIMNWRKNFDWNCYFFYLITIKNMIRTSTLEHKIIAWFFLWKFTKKVWRYNLEMITEKWRRIIFKLKSPSNERVWWLWDSGQNRFPFHVQHFKHSRKLCGTSCERLWKISKRVVKFSCNKDSINKGNLYRVTNWSLN